MSNYEDNYHVEIDKSLENSRHFNFDDLDPDGELYQQFASQRKKDRVKMAIAGFAVGLLLTVGIGYYVSEANANSDTGLTSLDSGYTASATGSYTSSGQSGSTGSSGPVGGVGAGGGGGCCGGGAGGGGAGGGSIGSASLSDLEKQALAEYTKETGAKDVKAKATNFGCHIQIDITDKKGSVIRSYGFQGGPLYVIK